MKYLQQIGPYTYFRRNGKRHRMPLRDDPAFMPIYNRLLAGKKPDAPMDGSMAELVAVYRLSPEYRALADRSRVTRDFYLNIVERDYGRKGYKAFTRGQAIRIRDKFAETPGKANNLMSTFAVLFKCAVDREMMPFNPCLKIERLRIGEHRPWTDKEIDAAFDAASPLTRLALALLLYTGQRVTDVLKMEWKHVKADVIEVVQQKTGKTVWVPLHRRLKAELDRAPRHMRWLLYNANGEQMKISALEKRIKVLRNRIDAKKMRWHGLRKNVVNNLLELGCSTAEVAAITGQTLQTIEHYAKGRDVKTLAKSAMQKWENG